MVVPIRKDVTFTVVDKDTGESIGDITVQVNKGEERFLYPIKSTYTVKNLFPLDSVHIRSAFYNTLHVKASEILNFNTPFPLEHEMILHYLYPQHQM